MYGASTYSGPFQLLLQWRNKTRIEDDHQQDQRPQMITIGIKGCFQDRRNDSGKPLVKSRCMSLYPIMLVG